MVQTQVTRRSCGGEDGQKMAAFASLCTELKSSWCATIVKREGIIGVIGRGVTGAALGLAKEPRSSLQRGNRPESGARDPHVGSFSGLLLPRRGDQDDCKTFLFRLLAFRDGGTLTAGAVEARLDMAGLTAAVFRDGFFFKISSENSARLCRRRAAADLAFDLAGGGSAMAGCSCLAFAGLAALPGSRSMPKTSPRSAPASVVFADPDRRRSRLSASAAWLISSRW